MTIQQFIFLSFLTFICMIFSHIREDFYQSEFLSIYKQKSNWEKDAIGRKSLYKHDYKACLFIHSLQWAITIHIPIILELSIISYFKGIQNFRKIDCIVYISSILIWLSLNIIIHFIVDDLKANKHKINLIQDQIIHLIQIVITFVFYTYIFINKS